MKILAGIVLYNPDPQRLVENISAIKEQVDCVAVFDNGGGEAAIACKNEVVVLSEGGKNIGIASALNKLCEYALDNGYDWVLTLDQDSVCPDNIISEYRKHIGDDEKLALLCPRVNDRNIGMEQEENLLDTQYVEFCITSASLVNVDVWQKMGGGSFMDDLFIDLVDFDYCWTVLEHGYKILQVNSVVLYHELGHSRKVKLFGKEEAVFNHPPIRSYYMSRSNVIVGRKHKRLNQCVRWQAKRTLLINLYERNRWAKDKMIIKGLIDGIRYKFK